MRRGLRGWDRGVLAVRLGCLGCLSAVGGLVFWSHAPVLVGWQPRVVLTGSMVPSVQPGDVVLVASAPPADLVGPASLPVGRIVLVDDPTRPTGSYLHRVSRYDEAGRMVTRGDANQSEDVPSVDPARVRGQVRLLVPRVGTPLVWLRQGRRLDVALLGLGLWVAFALALGLRAPSAGHVPPTPADDTSDEPDGDLAATGAATGAARDVVPS